MGIARPFARDAMTRNWLRFAVGICGGLALRAADVSAQIDTSHAAEWFAEADSLCRRDNGALWGVSLCGPMVFADPVTRTIATNRPPPNAPRPPALGYANAAMEWGGERWSTFVWQAIPGNEIARARLFAHELFHRIQPPIRLYIASAESAPDHLDTPEGRSWMVLEWRALALALQSSGTRRDAAVRDALAFRAARRGLSASAGESERIVEINEGLAQYTGTRLASPTWAEAAADAVEQLARAESNESFVRTFAYPSGAAYGLLLEAEAPGWTRRISARDDLGELIGEAMDASPSDPNAASQRYGGEDVRAAEDLRGVRRLARITKLRQRFVEGPVLVFPRGRNASFVTTGVTPIPGAGTIYPQYRVTGPWGSVEAAHVLMSLDAATLAVPAPFAIEGQQIRGDDWTLALADGWEVRPGPRPGDFQIVPVDKP
jgi:hypothetical protein